jgi:hypothetical protein
LPITLGVSSTVLEDCDPLIVTELESDAAIPRFTWVLQRVPIDVEPDATA